MFLGLLVAVTCVTQVGDANEGKAAQSARLQNAVESAGRPSVFLRAKYGIDESGSITQSITDRLVDAYLLSHPVEFTLARDLRNILATTDSRRDVTLLLVYGSEFAPPKEINDLRSLRRVLESLSPTDMPLQVHTSVENIKAISVLYIITDGEMITWELSEVDNRFDWVRRTLEVQEELTGKTAEEKTDK